MYTAAKLALVLLAAAAPVAAAAQGSNPADDLRAIYDPTARVTSVSTSLRKETGTSSRPPLYLSFQTTHPDTIPSRPLEVFELFLSVAVAKAHGHHFTGVDEATLLVDDSVEIALQGEHRAAEWTERIVFPVSLSQALKLSTARSVHGRIGSWEFDLTPGEIARIGRLVAYARLDPGAPVPDRWTVTPGEFSGQGPL
ncbi:MAG TPA: hypothetical protein VGB24_19440 [Longimicrobium sp.]|jgi:hypothetical protein|uniref:hypothetical protein n=1 Tax=Longimicrobium sp. TaxID=2029185 RepID=UPI002EDAB21C